MRKPAFCICENKDADQLRSNCEADQRLCFRYSDSTIPLLPKSEISSLKPYSVIAQPGLCHTWSETPKTGFLTTRLLSNWAIRKPALCTCQQQRCGSAYACCLDRYHLSLVMRKLVFGVFDQVRHKPSCTTTQDG